MMDPLDGLDDSLQDFDPTANPLPRHHHHHHLNHHHLNHSAFRSDPAVTEMDEEEDRDLDVSEIASGGGYSPPAWRRLGNGDRSSGFWRGPHDFLAALPRGISRESSPDDDAVLAEDIEAEENSEDDMVLERAIRTKLPKGSASPDKGRSPSPERSDDRTLQVNNVRTTMNEVGFTETPADNCECFPLQ